MMSLQKHILFRTLGLLVLGVFMVNAEGGYNQEHMLIPIHLWTLIFYAAVILIWKVYPTASNRQIILIRIIGFVILIALAVLYRGGEDGSDHMTPKWWGILGLIGWAYLLSCILYQLCDGQLLWLFGAMAACLGFYALGHQGIASLHWMAGQTGHAVHTMITLAGIVTSLIYFDTSHAIDVRKRFAQSLLVALGCAGIAWALRPFYGVSKIFATPSWGLYCAAICMVVFAFLYWLIDIRRISGWTGFLRPAASNPLLTYIIPFILYAALKLFGISLPDIFYSGIFGVIWSAAYAIIVVAFVAMLNKFSIKLQL